MSMTNTAALLSDAPLGKVTRRGETMQVSFQRHYGVPVEKVWAALTTPERIADWFGKAKVDLRVGGAITMEWADMKITVCEPPRNLTWVWELDGRDTLVSFALVPEAGGCALTLTHSNLDPHGKGSGVRAGWHAHLEAIPDALEGRNTPGKILDARIDALSDAYPPLN